MLYEWRNIPRSDGYSPAQLLFGRAQRTSLPTLPCQNKPIDFNSAVSAKDAAHDRSKIYHDNCKLALPRLSPGQEVYLQDSKSSAWDRRGVIVSMRPDKLSYIIDSDNHIFTRPRRLLRPVSPATPSLSDVPAISSALHQDHHGSVPLRRSSRLQGIAPSAVALLSDSTSAHCVPSSSSWNPSLKISASNALSLIHI